MKMILPLLLLMLTSITSAQAPPVDTQGNTAAVDPKAAERVPGVTSPPSHLTPRSDPERVVFDAKGEFGVMLMRSYIIQTRACSIIGIIFGVVLIIGSLLAILFGDSTPYTDNGTKVLINLVGFTILLFSVYYFYGAIIAAAMSVLQNTNIPMILLR